MKRILFGFFAMIAIAAVVSSCTKTVHTTDNTNSNAALSQTFEIATNEWQIKDGGLYLPLAFNEITWDIVDKGLVVAYLSFDNGQSYEILPTMRYNVNYSFSHTNKNITIYGYNIYGDPIVKPNEVVVLKVVSIAAKSLTIKSVNLKDYKAVKAAFNLKD